eukprot:TRINITY_DN21592_c0_g4_i1.p1 TRINITY_DN21592_c0_g4~~TRINITY_DN21592_c0_g4_i1.p1  ORF type:complete len:746 (-),score=111.50 TRINITY_DN21592_c0_g4_i1:70-2253(-)
MASEERICRPGGSGLLMPVGGDAEQRLADPLRTFLYGVALAYSFVGVSIVADMFMNSIEAITARVVRVQRPGSDRLMTRKVWNDTVANLTLMALGSSAPEIMLSVVETLKLGNFSGPLGPSTILGSASFNLMVIIAACILAIPSTEVRCIAALPVFYVTAVFSVLAYVWLLVIVDVISPNVVEIWEALVTLLLLPVLVVISFACDKGWVCSTGSDDADAQIRQIQVFKKEVSACSGESAEPAMGLPELEGGTGGSGSEATISIVPGEKESNKKLASEKSQSIIAFDYVSDELRVACGLADQRDIPIKVNRLNGSVGQVTCAYSLRGLSAVPSFDYEEIEEGKLEFPEGVVSAEIKLTVLPRRPGQRSVQLQVVLENLTGSAVFHPDMDGGEEQSLLTVTIANDDSSQTGGACLNMLDSIVGVNSLKLGFTTWLDNAISAVKPAEDWSEGNAFDRAIIIMMYPWMVLYSILVPPPEFFGGWICFVASLVHIFGLTAVIVDLAELFGCVAGVKDAMTAISFVALGTSMPDFFASKTAALQDEDADASIVNVTGSNSVNVFLGIGLPWTIASIYWAVRGPTEEYKRRYPEMVVKHHPNAVFVVESGDLSFAVATFSVVALITLAIIMWRRAKIGGELGGPFVPKVSSAFSMVALWAWYIGICGWRFENGSADIGTQVGIASATLAGVLLTCATFTAITWLIHRLKGSNTSVAPGDCGAEATQSKASVDIY